MEQKIVTLEVVARNGEVIDLELSAERAVDLYRDLARILPLLFGPGYVVSLVRLDSQPQESSNP